MPDAPLRIAILGCGNISTRYSQTLEAYTDKVRIVGYYDVQADRAEAFAQEFGGQAYPSIEALVSDEQVDLVANLTIHTAHFETTRQALRAGRNVFCEKPLALSYAEAKELVDLADARGVILAGAPMTFMGDAQQTAWKQIRDGVVGTPRLVYAEVNHGRIESWHPAPGPFYAVGPLWDVGVYPLTLATTFFGPAKRVATAYQRVLFPHRKTKEGNDFTIETPEFATAVIELESGVLVRLTTDFYVHRQNTHQKGRFEVHGDGGSVVLGDFQSFNTDIEASAFGEALTPVPPLHEPYVGIEWARAIVEIADAIAEDRTPRLTGKQAAHIVEIIEAITSCVQSGRPVELSSRFDPPAPMDWAQ